MFSIEALVGQVELFAKGFSGEVGLAVETEDVIGGCEDGGEVVRKGAGPVENDVTDHEV